VSVDRNERKGKMIASLAEWRNWAHSKILKWSKKFINEGKARGERKDKEMEQLGKEKKDNQKQKQKVMHGEKLKEKRKEKGEW